MIFDNCSKYIEDKIFARYSLEYWRAKNIVFPTLDLLSKTMVCILRKYNIQSMMLFSQLPYLENWAGVRLQRNWNDLFNNGDNVVIVLTDIECKDIILNKIKTNNSKLLDNIVDFTDIRMNRLPNVVKRTLENYPLISLRDVQIKELEILKYFKNFCDKHGLRYYLDYGTLLGAVRHKGFIPWDDDLDVAMPMMDYLKLCEIFPRDGEWFFDSMFNECVDDYTVSTLTKIKSKQMGIEYHSFPLRILTGVGMDIFPLCGYPSDKNEQIKYMNEFQLWADIWKEKVVIPYGTEAYSREEHKNIAAKMVEISLHYDFDMSQFVGPAYFGYDTYIAAGCNRVLSKSFYAGSMKMIFEDDCYSVPSGYDDILKNWYGDYMTIPKYDDNLHMKSCIRNIFLSKELDGIWK